MSKNVTIALLLAGPIGIGFVLVGMIKKEYDFKYRPKEPERVCVESTVRLTPIVKPTGLGWYPMMYCTKWELLK